MKIKTNLFVALILLLGASCQTSEKPIFSADDSKAILALLKKQQEDWNRGDIPAFMEGYQKSDSMQFIGKDGINFGWKTTLDNYKLRYPDTVVMGKLKFEILRINPLSADAAFLTGKFYLRRSIGDASGIFTLVLRKENSNWLIVYDHTGG